MAKTLRPGETCTESGQYETVGPRGGKVGNGEKTLVKGKPAPPTEKPGQVHVLVDPTKHKK